MIMKKIYSIIATAIIAVGFTACTQSDFVETSAPDVSATSIDNAIQFGTYLGKTGTTRAGDNGAIDNTTTLQSKGFGVFAFNTGSTNWANDQSTYYPNFMYNQQVTYGSSTWSYTPLKYWPNGIDAANTASTPSNSATESGVQQLSFFAYAPYVNASNDGTFSPAETTGITGLTANNATTAPKVTYALTSTSNGFLIGSNVDLLWGLRGSASYSETDNGANAGTVGTDYNVNLTKQTTGETVDFLFKHALTKVGGSAGLKIVADLDANGYGETGIGSKDATTLITVRSITIGNVVNAVTTTGTFNLATGVWTATNNPSIAASTPINLAFNADGTDSKIILNSDIAEAVTTSNTNCPIWNSTQWETNNGSSAASGTAIGGVTTTAKNVYNADGDAFYLIPGQNDQTLTVTVDYVVRTYDAKLAAPSNDVSNCSKVEQTITNTVTLPAATLKPNKYFTLVLHLGLTSVRFSALVDSWDVVDDDDVEEIWLPSNVVTSTTTISAGSSSTVYTAADATSYTINLTGLTEGSTVSATGTNHASSATLTPSYTSGTSVQADGLATISITGMTANTTSSPANNVITITEATVGSTVTNVTVVQVAAE